MADRGSDLPAIALRQAVSEADQPAISSHLPTECQVLVRESAMRTSFWRAPSVRAAAMLLPAVVAACPGGLPGWP